MWFFRKAPPEVVEPPPPPRRSHVVQPKKTEWITLTEDQYIELSAPVKIDLPAVAESKEGLGRIIPFKAHREKGKSPGTETDGCAETGGHSAV